MPLLKRTPKQNVAFTVRAGERSKVYKSRTFNQRMVWLGAIGLTVSVGAGVITLLRYRPPDTVQPTSAQPTESTSEADITFTGGVSTSAFQTHYWSSDGKFLRFGCFERASTRVANLELRDYRSAGRVIEQGPKVNDDGERVGERIVVDEIPGLETEANIVWTEHSRIFLIRAPTVRHALLFEKSQMWADDNPCIDVATLARQAQRRN
jgi:hypothetical protein